MAISTAGASPYASALVFLVLTDPDTHSSGGLQSQAE